MQRSVARVATGLSHADTLPWWSCPVAVLSLGVEEASTASDGTAHKPVVPEPCASVDDATLRDSDLVWEKVYTGKVCRGHVPATPQMPAR